MHQEVSDEVQIYPETLSWQWKAVSKESTGIFSFSEMLWFQAPPVLQPNSSEIQPVQVAWKASESSSSKARGFWGVCFAWVHVKVTEMKELVLPTCFYDFAVSIQAFLVILQPGLHT